MANDPRVTIYTTDDCAYCGMVKRYLGLKGLAYEEINVQHDPEKRREMIAISGQMRVPVTVITKTDGRQEIAIGYNVSKISSALG